MHGRHEGFPHEVEAAALAELQRSEKEAAVAEDVAAGIGLPPATAVWSDVLHFIQKFEHVLTAEPSAAQAPTQDQLKSALERANQWRKQHLSNDSRIVTFITNIRVAYATQPL